MSERKDKPPVKDHPLDMKTAIKWYIAEADRLTRFLPNPSETPLAVPVGGVQYFHIEPNEISALISLFPETSISRSSIDKIEGMGVLYFDKQSTSTDIKVTEDVEEAISPTAIVPAKTNYSVDEETGEIKSTVVLFAIPEEVDPRVRRIMHAEGIIHEYAHTLITPILFSASYRLKLSSGEEIEGKELIERFVALAEQTSSFSHYSGEYRQSGRFPDEARKIAIGEELSEAVVAQLLGYIFCEGEDRRLDPFSDRPEMKQFVRDFLNASKVE